MDEKQTVARLHPFALGMSLGVIWSLSTFIMALFVMGFEYGQGFVSGMSNLYIGYEASLLGAFIGMIWGFIDAFVGGFLIAWLYNFFSCCCHKKCGSKKVE